MLHYKINVKGNVQGVGYRYAAYQKANILGVKGTVQNLDDGSVEITANANPEQMEQFVHWCKQGPDRALVQKVQSQEITEVPTHSFIIVRS